MSAPLDAVAPVLAALREWHPAYQRWWRQRCLAADAEVPWSAADQARLERLALADPDGLVASAGRLDGVAARVADVGRAVRAIGARGGLGAAAAEQCAGWAAMAEARAGEASSLAGELRTAAAWLESTLDDVVGQLRRVGECLADAGWGRAPSLGHRDGDRYGGSDGARTDVAGGDVVGGDSGSGGEGRRADWAQLDELVRGHGPALRALRTALVAADRDVPLPGGGWCSDPPVGAGSGSAGVWVGDQPLGGGAGSAGVWTGDQPVGRGSSPAEVWASEGPAPARELVVDRPYVDRVWQVWEPLAPASPPPSVTEVRPGVGPLLAGTEGSRTGTDTGVQIPRLSDGPPPRRGRHTR